MKWLEYGLKILLAAGLAGLLGVAGASDMEQITLWQSVWQLFFCAGISALAGAGLRICKIKQKQRANARVVYLYSAHMRRANSRQKRRMQAQI